MFMKKEYKKPMTDVAEVDLSSVVMIGMSEGSTESGGGLSGEEVGSGLAPGRSEEWEEM